MVYDLDEKFGEIQEAAGVPMTFLVSTGSAKSRRDPYRKPAKGLIDMM